MVGTQTRLIACAPVDVKTGRAKEAGDYRIYGCPGSGAPIIMDYRDVSNHNQQGHSLIGLDCRGAG